MRLLSDQLARASRIAARSGAEGPRIVPKTRAGALARLAEAEDTLRAIGAGEVDAFVVSDGGSGRRVFTLSTADRPYRMFVEQMREGAATVSASGLILYANPRLAELLSYSRATIVGAPLSHFISDAAALAGADADGQPALGAVLECDLLGRDGKIVPVLVGSSVLEVDGDRLSCLTFTDMTAHKAQERAISRLSDDRAIRMAELQQAQAALTALATHDGLTGLPNRALLVDRIDQALFRARRLSSSTALLFIDLDRFKQINDMQGHAAGDEVLRSVGDRLVGALRPMDTVARIGGDEFVVLAPEIESEMRAMDLSARLLAELDRRDAHVGHGLSCSASVGIAISVGGRGDGETLLSEADTAMYRAKSRGGGRAELFDAALGREVQKRSAAQRTIEAALDEQRIKVHYQPVVAVSTGRLDGFEALARIAKRDGNLLGPADFIPVAEETGLVVPLGTRVLELACQQAKRWAPDGLARRDATVAVNLSARQFATGELPGVVRRTLQHTGLDPSRLHLELTETAIMGLHPDILKQLASISDLGVQLGLDDFGTGYASLAHLRRLPLTFVKIDQTFVTGLGVDHEDERIVAAVVDLAANLGLRSIAEGIESVAQLDRLREFGCDQAQGYLFARPLPPDGVATYMELPPP